MARVLGLLLALLVATAVAPAGAATSPACGDVVTENLVLASPLTGCENGLVAGADDIVIDLNGYTIQGLDRSLGVGIDLGGRSGVTVRNGVIRDFAEGVVLRSTQRSTVSALTIRGTRVGITLGHFPELPPADANTVKDNTIRDAETGIWIGGDGDLIDSNRIDGATAQAIFIRTSLFPTYRVAISNNRITDSGIGINQLHSAADIIGNQITGSRLDGMLLYESNDTVLGNLVNRNGGNGISGPDSHNLYRDNVTNDNGGSGLVFDDIFGDHGHLMEVTNHTSYDNGGYGIHTGGQTVVDGGGNRARGNGSSPQCVGVVCRIPRGSF